MNALAVYQIKYSVRFIPLNVRSLRCISATLNASLVETLFGDFSLYANLPDFADIEMIHKFFVALLLRSRFDWILLPGAR